MTKIVELLSGGLEENQKRQLKEEEEQAQKGVVGRLNTSLSGFRKMLGFGTQE